MRRKLPIKSSSLPTWLLVYALSRPTGIGSKPEGASDRIWDGWAAHLKTRLWVMSGLLSSHMLKLTSNRRPRG